ncbi:MAG TPA: hypothetical protein VHP33_04690 [Polyangiaceae bacterium]|nr:hypothetical protein [Polyangiaceae bacterium]
MVTALALRSVGLCLRLTITLPSQAPLARDPDRRPFHAKLEPYFSPTEWDHQDKTFFTPVTRFLAVSPGGEAVNVNALDEVPDSSWFENRVERLGADGMARGPCEEAPADVPAPWQVVGGKPDGVVPGFMIKDAAGQRYVLKLDGGLQGPHGSVADVVGSRIYFAAGFDVPCNRVVHFERSQLALSKKAHIELADGDKAPMSWRHVERALSRTMRLPDGRFRAAASRFLAGQPLGPWRYEGTREGDRNDVVPHEDRRELRGSKLLAAWTGHWDAREQNTLAMWIETGNGAGFVRHHLLDFGDCFGTFAGASPVLVRRRGLVYWFDPWQVMTDFATLGVVERPWESVELGRSGPVFGFYDVEHFEPASWSTTYPNVAFGRMTERDAAWMARIIARIGEPELTRIVEAARLSPDLGKELVRLLMGRRRKLLERYLGRLSPLARPALATNAGHAWLCADDVAVLAGVAGARKYSARAWVGAAARPLTPPQVRTHAGGQVCVALPALPEASAEHPDYYIVELATQDAPALPFPARFHVYHSGQGRYLLAGVEREASYAPPG